MDMYRDYFTRETLTDSIVKAPYLVPGCNLLFFNKYKLLRLFLLNEDLVGTL